MLTSPHAADVEVAVIRGKGGQAQIANVMLNTEQNCCYDRQGAKEYPGVPTYPSSLVVLGSLDQSILAH